LQNRKSIAPYPLQTPGKFTTEKKRISNFSLSSSENRHCALLFFIPETVLSRWRKVKKKWNITIGAKDDKSQAKQFKKFSGMEN